MRWGALVMMVVAGCVQPKLSRADGVLLLEPQSLEAKAFVGHPVERTVSISNAGRAVLSVGVSATSGLTLVGGSGLRLQAGQTLAVTVRIDARSAGALAETIGFTVDGVESQVPVTGEIVAVPSCGAAEACQTVRFDPIGGGCVEEPRADGSACAAACLAEASCQAGKCVGTARSCDDGNKCTADACDSEGGCTHVDTSAKCSLPCEGEECNPDNDACNVPICDPLVGCRKVPAADGTSCGANDCSTARVCMLGICRTMTSPQGSKCSEATPCQSEGQCVGTSCVAAQHPIVPAWEVADTAKVKHTLLGVVSPGGMIFGVERHDVGIFIVAYDAGGFERWRTPLYSDYGGWQALYDVERAQLVLASKTWVRALDGATGAQKWFVDLTAEIPLGNATSTGAKQVYPAKLSLLPGAKRVIVAFSEGSDAHVIWVFGLDLATGQQTFKFRRDGHLYGLMTTSSDELFVSSASCWTPSSWNAAFDAAGAKRWDTFQEGMPALTSGSQVYFQPSGNPSNFVGRIDLQTGSMSQEAQGHTTAILANGSTLFITSSISTSSRLTAWDVTTHKELWKVSPVPLTQAFLTQGGGVLGLSLYGAAHVSSSGSIEWSCAIEPLSTTLTASLLNGQLVANTKKGIGGFPVGALKVSPTGWSVSNRGNPEATSRAR
jgi:hypothetical protein